MVWVQKRWLPPVQIAFLNFLVYCIVLINPKSLFWHILCKSSFEKKCLPYSLKIWTDLVVHGSPNPNLKIWTDSPVNGSLHSYLKILTHLAVRGSLRPNLKIRTNLAVHGSLHPYLKILTHLAVRGSLRPNLKIRTNFRSIDPCFWNYKYGQIWRSMNFCSPIKKNGLIRWSLNPNLKKRGPLF